MRGISMILIRRIYICFVMVLVLSSANSMAENVCEGYGPQTPRDIDKPAGENKVAFSRQAFNDAVLGYNNKAENFPNNVIAGMFRFELASFLEIQSEEKREVPKVAFT